jgi:hypothetical protein
MNILGKYTSSLFVVFCRLALMVEVPTSLCVEGCVSKAGRGMADGLV